MRQDLSAGTWWIRGPRRDCPLQAGKRWPITCPSCANVDEAVGEEGRGDSLAEESVVSARRRREVG